GSGLDDAGGGGGGAQGLEGGLDLGELLEVPASDGPAERRGTPLGEVLGGEAAGEAGGAEDDDVEGAVAAHGWSLIPRRRRARPGGRQGGCAPVTAIWLALSATIARASMPVDELFWRAHAEAGRGSQRRRDGP